MHVDRAIVFRYTKRTVSPSAAEHAHWAGGIRCSTFAQTSPCDAGLPQMGVVPLTRWYDVFTGMLPRFFSDPHNMLDKLMHDRLVVPFSHPPGVPAQKRTV